MDEGSGLGNLFSRSFLISSALAGSKQITAGVGKSLFSIAVTLGVLKLPVALPEKRKAVTAVSGRMSKDVIKPELFDGSYVLPGDHAPVADEDDSFETEPLLEILDHPDKSGGVCCIAGKDMVAAASGALTA